MSEEIENILGNINFEVETEQEWLEPLGLDKNTWKQILNYITNLQQENKQLKKKYELEKYKNSKALVYIKQYSNTNYLDFRQCEIIELLEILGEKENE